MGLIFEMLSVEALVPGWGNLRSKLKTALQSGRNQKNFFETRVTQYQAGDVLFWD